MDLLKTIGDIIWFFLIGLIIVVICCTFYNAFSAISAQAGTASVVIIGILFLCDFYCRQRKQCAPI
jgi:hypothetical protein